MDNIYTDLAVERREMYTEGKDVEIEGVSVDILEMENYSVTRIEVLNRNGQEIMQKQ